MRGEEDGVTKFNRDPRKSAQPCGCDEGAQHVCKECQSRIVKTETSGEIRVFPNSEDRLTSDFSQPLPSTGNYAKGAPRPQLFPESAQGRKDHPVFTGFLMYFPDAIAAVARVSKKGNDQHNPGQPLHWAREKSTDQLDTATRHMMDHGTGTTKDNDGEYHLAKAAWRNLAELQLTIEREREGR
jgi:hypothetical protein